MGVRNRAPKRSQLQVKSDDAVADLQRRLGKMLLDARKGKRLTQAHAADLADIARSKWSNLERGKKGATLWIVSRAAHAVGAKLNAYIEGASAADLPKDAVHLRNEELVLKTSTPGGWEGLPEEELDRDLTRSRHGDVVLKRQRFGAPREYALCEVTDWLPDVGEATRDFSRRLAALDRYAVARMKGDEPVPSTSGFWLLRATRRNRQLVADHRSFFRARFPGSGHEWLASLRDPDAPVPTKPALLWVAVSGDRMFASRLG
jgi:transcriptional regulator with XRE-family HTH domain